MAGAGLRIYIDDSGEKEYGANTSRYFVYAGVVVDRTLERAISGRIDALKLTTFKTTDVEIKSNWLRMPRERERRYLEKYAISEDALKDFVEELYLVMASEDLTYIAAAIDKPQMLEHYGAERAWYPSTTAYQFLLQRYEKHCASLGVTGYITIDDMSGSTPKRNHWRDLLRTHHARLKKDGCQLTKMMFPSIVNTPLFASSRDFNLLQVADVLAYNVFRQFRDHGDRWDAPNAARVPTYDRLSPLLPRFRIGDQGVLEGWGIVKWPRRRAGKWGYQPDK
jgi:hypothetical protein